MNRRKSLAEIEKIIEDDDSSSDGNEILEIPFLEDVKQEEVNPVEPKTKKEKKNFQKININTISDYNRLSLSLQLMQNRNVSIVDIYNVWLLISLGFDTNEKDEFGVTPLINATKIGKLSIVWMLLRKKAKINGMNIFGETALIVACKRKKIKCMKYLIKKGADVQIIDKAGNSALRWAVKHNDEQMVKSLLKADASLIKDTATKNNSMDIAKQNGNIELYEILRDQLILERRKMLANLHEIEEEDIRRNARKRAKEQHLLMKELLQHKHDKKKQVKEASYQKRVEERLRSDNVTMKQEIKELKHIETESTCKLQWVKKGKAKWDYTSTEQYLASEANVSYAADIQKLRKVIAKEDMAIDFPDNSIELPYYQNDPRWKMVFHSLKVNKYDPCFDHRQQKQNLRYSSQHDFDDYDKYYPFPISTSTKH